MISFILIFCLCFFASCNSKPVHNNEVKTINVSFNGNESVNLSEFVDSLQYIVLEDYDESSMIQEITKLEIADSLLFILDKEMKKILCFHENGAFLRTIGNVGGAPGEYIAIDDFCLNEKGELIVLDRSGKKILIYDHNGHYRTSYKIDMTGTQIAAIGDKYLFYTRGIDYHTMKKEYGYNLFLTDSTCQVEEMYFAYNEATDDFLFGKVFDVDVDFKEVLFNYAVYDTIYQFDTKGIVDKFFINFGDKRLPVENMTTDNNNTYFAASKYATIIGVRSAGEYCFINYTYKNRVRLLFVKDDKVTNAQFVENDIDNTLYLLMPDKVIGDHAYYIRESSDMTNYYNQDTVWVNTKNGIKKYITTESNPVIVKAFLK
ncbi:hypothetical protein M2480_002142 [Parabacteroides sp. PFB2-12]|uniref:6-bladed beta-propeller n=1 Tax=unclassified Parabacteroides TaxID=2649774 RepID=UPI002473CF70|nr:MULTISPECIES: 6-bladed beta-propeller [unclassified Parabacteroides]MDH6342164.1 hypothetical protein [Parabacteroides sp. PM6-13]MDH6391152.1 hypothetical protein [Parabacteroides sp. PFB2-12]